jgi:hypothetical protein
MTPISLGDLPERWAEEQAKGYRGARIDPNPNSAYSQETDPMTSPRAERHGSNFVIIDEYVDPDSPYADQVHDRTGLSDADVLAENTHLIVAAVPAEATASDEPTTTLDETAPADGTVTGATFTPTATITGHADNNRTFTLRNATTDEDLGLVTTVATKTAATAYALTLDGTPTVSQDDELEVVESVAGTGVAHGGGTFRITVTATDAS